MCCSETLEKINRRILSLCSLHSAVSVREQLVICDEIISSVWGYLQVI